MIKNEIKIELKGEHNKAFVHYILILLVVLSAIYVLSTMIALPLYALFLIIDVLCIDDDTEEENDFDKIENIPTFKYK